MLTANIIWWNMGAKVPNVGEAFCTTLDTFTENFSVPQFPNKIYIALAHILVATTKNSAPFLMLLYKYLFSSLWFIIYRGKKLLSSKKVQTFGKY